MAGRTTEQPTVADASLRIGDLLAVAPDAMLVLEARGRIALANTAAGELFGCSAEDLVGRTTRTLFIGAGVSSNGNGSHARDGRQQLTARRLTGEELPVEVGRNAVETAEGRMVVMSVRDISERCRHEEEMQYLAEHDSLTGLLNRDGLHRAMKEHVAKRGRRGRSGVLLLIDLDQFKYINDALGHKRGNAVIMRAARTLEELLTDTDVLARSGGDEFAVLRPGATIEEGEVLANDLLRALRVQPVPFDGLLHPLTASIGVAAFETRATSEDVLRNSDLAMYDAKQAGGNQVGMFRAGCYAEGRLRGRLSWSERICRAIDEDSLELVAQPVECLNGGGTFAHELLLRMPGDEGGPISPAVLFSIAERLGMATLIDAWVFNQAVALLRGGAVPEEMKLTMNLSGRSIGDEALLGLIRDELQRTRIDPWRLIFEITETAAIEDIRTAQRFSAELTSLGCRLALDDFGAGFGSFYYLKHLPFDYLKIDGEFVSDCARAEIDQVVIRSLVTVAAGLGKKTIAEFVGDDETVKLLRELGVDYGQGFHLGKPTPVTELFGTYR